MSHRPPYCGGTINIEVISFSIFVKVTMLVVAIHPNFALEEDLIYFHCDVLFPGTFDPGVTGLINIITT